MDLAKIGSRQLAITDGWQAVGWVAARNHGCRYAVGLKAGGRERQVTITHACRVGRTWAEADQGVDGWLERVGTRRAAGRGGAASADRVRIGHGLDQAGGNVGSGIVGRRLATTGGAARVGVRADGIEGWLAIAHAVGAGRARALAGASSGGDWRSRIGRRVWLS